MLLIFETDVTGHGRGCDEFLADLFLLKSIPSPHFSGDRKRWQDSPI
jgi:hypothetical protein